jgi:hypothetical protein
MPSRRRRTTGATARCARRRGLVVVVGRPRGEATAEGSRVQGLRRGGQGQGVARQGIRLSVPSNFIVRYYFFHHIVNNLFPTFYLS